MAIQGEELNDAHADHQVIRPHNWVGAVLVHGEAPTVAIGVGNGLVVHDEDTGE